MGKRKQRQESLLIMADGLPKSAAHPFYQKLNALLAEADFDRWIEGRCQGYDEHDEQRGQPSIAPGVYFRRLLAGYFEGIDSQRGDRLATELAEFRQLGHQGGARHGADSRPAHRILTAWLNMAARYCTTEYIPV